MRVREPTPVVVRDTTGYVTGRRRGGVSGDEVTRGGTFPVVSRPSRANFVSAPSVQLAAAFPSEHDDDHDDDDGTNDSIYD